MSDMTDRSALAGVPISYWPSRKPRWIVSSFKRSRLMTALSAPHCSAEPPENDARKSDCTSFPTPFSAHSSNPIARDMRPIWLRAH